MQAIVLSQENRDKIVTKLDELKMELSPEALDAMILEYDRDDMHLIFIPKFDRPGERYHGWASIPWDGFETYFEPIELDKLKADFVDVSYKLA